MNLFNIVKSTTEARYQLEILEVAVGEVGVREVPRNSNLGPQVELYQASVGPYAIGNAWCSCFVYWVCKEAAASMGLPTNVVKTGRAISHWIKDDRGNIMIDINDLTKVKPGMLFVQVADEELVEHVRERKITATPGHIGFVTSEVDEDGFFSTIEGNGSPDGSREGGGVYARRRHVSENIVGFVKVTLDI